MKYYAQNVTITVAHIDLDKFKHINDHFGHRTGDLVLKKVAVTLVTNLRSTDIIARVGGDEFIILLPETGEESSEVTFAKLRNSLQNAMSQSAWEVT